MKSKELLSIAGLQYFSMGLNFLIQLYLTFLLAPQVFGLFAKISAVREIFIALLSANIPMAVIYIKEDDIEKLLSTSFYLGSIQAFLILIGGILFIIISFFFLKFETNELIIFYSLVFAAALSSIHQVMYSIFEKLERFKFNSTIVIVIQLFTGLVVIGVTFFVKDIKVLIIREILPAILLLIIYLVIAYRKWSINFLRFEKIDKTLLKKMLVYSTKMYFSRIVESIFFKLDILIASTIFNSNQLGIYERIKYFATLPYTLIVSLVQRITFVKYSKDLATEFVNRTNMYTLVLTLILYILLYFFITLFNHLIPNDILNQMFPLYFMFWSYAGFSSIIENVKTYYYAANKVIQAALLFRLLPILIFILLFFVLKLFISIDIYIIAFLTSIIYVIPLIYSPHHLIKIKFK